MPQVACEKCVARVAVRSSIDGRDRLMDSDFIERLGPREGIAVKKCQVAAAASLLLVAMALSLVPLAIVLGFSLWWPATMSYENYTLYVTAFPMMEHGYYFAKNAFLFSLVFAYPATLINDVIFYIFPQISEFERFGAFGVTLQVLYAIAITAVCGLAVFSRHLIFGEKLMMLWVALGYQVLTLLFRNVTEINYHMLEPLLYVVCATMTIRWLWTVRAIRGIPAVHDSAELLGGRLGR